MKFFPLYLLACLLCVPGLSLAGEKTVYGLNEYAELAGIDLQVAAEKSGTLSQSFTYVGTTQWLDEQRGLARVEVNFTDDLVALRAFKDALCAINEAVVL